MTTAASHPTSASSQPTSPSGERSVPGTAPGRFGALGSLALHLAACAIAGGLGGWLTSQGVGDWYRGLNRPSWNPPDWIFGPVWTTLFVMMAVAGWRVHEARGQPGRSAALALWWVQLGFNVVWSGLFFALRRPDLALVEIVILELLILGFVLRAWRVSPVAALLFVPYLAWVGFATLLNGTLWWLNRAA